MIPFLAKSSTKLVRKKIIFPQLFLLKELKLSASAHDPHFSEIIEQISKEKNYFSATVFLKWIESTPEGEPGHARPGCTHGIKVNEEAPQPPPPLSNALDDAKNLRGN